MSMSARRAFGEQERRELEALVADSADAAEAGLLYRWVSNGVAPLDQQERRQLALLVRRVAALGRLDSAEHREKFAAHGLGAAFRLEEEEMEQDQLSQWKEQQKLQEVKRITLKAQNRQTLTEEEAATVQSFKREEIDRLSRKQADDGLSQEERYMLDKMRTSLQHHDAFTAKQEDANSKVAAVVQKLESGAHVRPKERYEMYKVLEEEEKRLEQLEDEHGLRTQEIKQLAHLRKIRQDREEQKKQRKAKQDYMQLVNS
ncbi:hypothetical protein CYMTET_27082 [Cymbomonas tetramitiformis]|uniref:Uncharacterized protein n=1 Tax=Cymbomonas tetramitiformis TaxID=36881 RepID=A0AAE0FQF8_9CHLO|nr:hypothetical protein CYMTET_27082 [Cymbomonas tetramitiformis]